MTAYQRYGKRILDFALASTAIILIAPLFATLIFAVRLKLGSPVFFRQNRPGKNGRLFQLVKLRTMTSQRDSSGKLLPDELRLTRFGRWLRSTSLDELPELWNVLRGDMSLVGPRPLLERYLPLYSTEQARRHEVRPGITGLAQVTGRNAIGWEEKFRHDVDYVDQCSLWLDIKILALTCLKVIQRDGIHADGCATMPPFSGSDQKTLQGDRLAG